jgi:hypothetical protein
VSARVVEALCGGEKWRSSAASAGRGLQSAGTYNQADEDMRRDEPWLSHFANVVIWAIHPRVSLRLWWLERLMRGTERKTIYKRF